ncbi:MAG: ATP-binding cassette domain-containing protein [Nitrosopumilales archaeon]|nr:ATP-binding cassette domain-containing protein [Nitrosopumilales archaeon]
MQDLVAVSVKNLTYTYKVSSTSFSSNVLDNISFSVNKGDLLGVIGPNGAGKTTLFSCMLGLFKDYQGEVRIFGHDIRKNNNLILQSIGYIPQQKSIEQGFPATVQEIVSLGLIGKKNGSKEKVDSALEMVDLSGQNHRRIGELSGGQQQRVLIAKALVSEPKLLILDEPTTSVDVETQNKFYTLVKNLNLKNNLSIIWASHDLDAVNKIANKVMCLNRSMFFHGDSSEFFGSNELIRMYSESSMQLHMRSHSNQNKNLHSGYSQGDANAHDDGMKG